MSSATAHCVGFLRGSQERGPWGRRCGDEASLGKRPQRFPGSSQKPRVAVPSHVCLLLASLRGQPLLWLSACRGPGCRRQGGGRGSGAGPRCWVVAVVTEHSGTQRPVSTWCVLSRWMLRQPGGGVGAPLPCFRDGGSGTSPWPPREWSAEPGFAPRPPGAGEARVSGWVRVPATAPGRSLFVTRRHFPAAAPVGRPHSPARGLCPQHLPHRPRLDVPGGARPPAAAPGARPAAPHGQPDGRRVPRGAAQRRSRGPGAGGDVEVQPDLPAVPRGEWAPGPRGG